MKFRLGGASLTCWKAHRGIRGPGFFARPALKPHRLAWDGSGIKVYDQRRDVKNLKNPPPGGFKGNRNVLLIKGFV